MLKRILSRHLKKIRRTMMMRRRPTRTRRMRRLNQTRTVPRRRRLPNLPPATRSNKPRRLRKSPHSSPNSSSRCLMRPKRLLLRTSKRMLRALLRSSRKMVPKLNKRSNLKSSPGGSSDKNVQLCSQLYSPNSKKE